MRKISSVEGEAPISLAEVKMSGLLEDSELPSCLRKKHDSPVWLSVVSSFLCLIMSRCLALTKLRQSDGNWMVDLVEVTSPNISLARVEP